MKTNLNSKKLATLTVLTISAFLLSACGNSKSSPKAASSTAFQVGAEKVLASCNKTKDDNLSFNTGIVTDQNGQISTDWIKFKFNFVSSAMMTSGNVVKFFKWRVTGGTAALDNTPMTFNAYDLSTGQSTGSQLSAISADQISANYGFYIQLNDPNMVFQVLKVVVYNSEGKIVESLNSLIPGFYASPIDYQYNSDGTPRTVTLQQMHNLYGVDTASWSAAQLQQSFDQYCF